VVDDVEQNGVENHGLGIDVTGGKIQLVNGHEETENNGQHYEGARSVRFITGFLRQSYCCAGQL
jgi:hypothetical protein